MCQSNLLKVGSHRGGLRQLLRWKCVERRGILIISIGFIIIIDVFMPSELYNHYDRYILTPQICPDVDTCTENCALGKKSISVDLSP